MNKVLCCVAQIGALVAALVCGVAAACSDGGPPPIGDSDSAIPIGDSSIVNVPCLSPAPDCPCNDAGAQFACGNVYRISGTHVDCSPGYLTCNANDDGGTWSACVGASIYDGN